MSRLLAGAGKCEIDYPADIFPFQEGKDAWTGVHDVPCARVLVVEANIRFAYVSVEAVVLDGGTSARIKTTVSEAADVPVENVWVSSTHTVSTPHFFPVEHKTGEENPLGIMMNEHFIEAAASAAGKAAQNVKPVRAGYAQGYCTVNTNRMIPTCDGWWLGNGEELPSDHAVPVIRLDGEDGVPVAIIYNYACELSVMDNSTMRDGGLPNPLRAPIKEWKSTPAEDHTRSVEIMVLNDMAIISAGGLSAATAMQIKESSPFAKTIITEAVSGRAKKLSTDGAKGMADARSYELGTVHAKNSEFGPGAAEKLVANLTEFLGKLK